MGTTVMSVYIHVGLLAISKTDQFVLSSNFNSFCFLIFGDKNNLSNEN